MDGWRDGWHVCVHVACVYKGPLGVASKTGHDKLNNYELLKSEGWSIAYNIGCVTGETRPCFSRWMCDTSILVTAALDCHQIVMSFRKFLKQKFAPEHLLFNTFLNIGEVNWLSRWACGDQNKSSILKEIHKHWFDHTYFA